MQSISLVRALAVLLGAACVPPKAEMCDVGSQGCACTSGGACNPGLVCESNVCVAEGGATQGPTPSTSEGEEGEDSADATPATTADEDSDTSAGGSTGDPQQCDPALCTDVYCDNLREYCEWWLSNPANGDGDITNCDECVVTFTDGVAALPLVYCPEVFQCWVNCISAEGETNFDEVHDCIEIFCEGVNVSGTGLCE